MAQQDWLCVVRMRLEGEQSLRHVSGLLERSGEHHLQTAAALLFLQASWPTALHLLHFR